MDDTALNAVKRILQTLKIMPLFATLAAATPALAADPAPILKADREFAAMSVAKGPRIAFQTWLAPNATMINVGQLQSGTSATLVQDFPSDPRDFGLDWIPLGGAMSDDQTLGVTWGTYKRTVYGKLAATGAYSTVWRKSINGKWQVIEDSATETPAT